MIRRFLGLALLLSVAACGRPAPAANQPAALARLQVVSTVAPIVNIAHNIGGERIAITGIVPEGVNSHTFEPAPSDARQLAAADIIFANGLFLEEPTIRLAQANLKPGAELVLLADQTITAAEHVYDFSFPREGGHPNPHLWMNPRYALRYAELIRDTLARRDPAGADVYARNYAAFQARIEALDAQIQLVSASIPLENRRLVTYHDSFAYFAPRYGFEIIAAIQPADFAEPSAREVAQIITQLRAEQVPAVFGSEVFPSPVLDQIAKESGVSFVGTLRDDDLPGRPGEASHSYLGLMVQNVQTMARALGGQPELLDGFDTRNVSGPDTDVRQSEE